MFFTIEKLNLSDFIFVILLFSSKMGGESISKTESIPQIKKSVTMDSDSVNKQSTLSLTDAMENVIESQTSMDEKSEENHATNYDHRDDEPKELVKFNGEIKEGGKSGETFSFKTFDTHMNPKFIDHESDFITIYFYQQRKIFIEL